MRRGSISAPRRRKGLLVLLPLSIFRLANIFGSSQTFLAVEEVSFWLLSNFFHSSPRRSCTKHISKSASVCHFGSKNAHAVGLAESSRSPLAIDPKTVFGKPPEVFFCDCSQDISRRISRNFPGRPVARDFPVAGTCVKAQCGPPSARSLQKDARRVAVIFFPQVWMLFWDLGSKQENVKKGSCREDKTVDCWAKLPVQSKQKS